MTTLRPHRDRVLLELLAEEARSEGGIFIPDNAKKNLARQGVVLAVASDCKQPLQIGQTVYAIWNCGVPVELGAENETRLFKSEDVWAIGGKSYVRKMDSTRD